MTSCVIYDDMVHNTAQLFRVLSAAYGRSSVAYAHANELVPALRDRPDMLIMPGGASRYVAAKLNGAGNEAIKDYVARGGLYVGICAGAYYACRHTSWMQDAAVTPWNVDNELAFWRGQATGPLLERPQVVTLRDVFGAVHAALFWGGPRFEPDHDVGLYSVHARYSHIPGHPPAVISGRYDRGGYLLFSPHVEIDAEALKLMQFNVRHNRYSDLRHVEPLPDIPLRPDFFLRTVEVVRVAMAVAPAMPAP